MKKQYRIAVSGMLRLFQNYRLWVTVAWIVMLDYQTCHGIRMFALSQNLGVTPWLLPFLSCDAQKQLFIVLGATLIFGNAPFVDVNEQWKIVRAGRKNWFFGNIWYIIAASFVYTFCIAVIPIVMLIPEVGFSFGWGKVLGTLAQTNAGEVYGCQQLNYTIIIDYEPIRAMIAAFVNVWVVTILIALINYTFNLWTKRGTGAIVSSIAALSPMIITKLIHGYIGYYIAFPYWMNIGAYTTNYQFPSIWYRCGFYLILGIVLLLLSYLGVMKKDIMVVNDEW